jgi:manganese/zinc/iron transport system permease protein
MTSIIPDWQWAYDGWIVVVTSLVAVTCAIPGSFLLVRRQAMLGDAVSHAVLPGIAVGFLVSGSRGGGWMLIGAVFAGLATAMLTQLLRSVAGVDRGAALGVVFSTLFALGLVLLVQVAGSVDLDPACVLYGQLELVPLDSVKIAGLEMPRTVPWLFTILITMILVVRLLWKELLVASFDPATSNAQGVSSVVMNQVLMILVAVACVVAFEAVGSILVVSLLVAPPAIARCFFNRLGTLVPAAVIVGCVVAVLGYVLASRAAMGSGLVSVEISIAGTTAVVGAVSVACAALIRPLGFLFRASTR